MPVLLDPEALQREAATSEIAAVARNLQEHLGQKLTAYLAGLTDAKVVGRWAAGRAQPRDAAAMRLREAYQAARLIAGAYGDETAKAWFAGSNTRLDDEAPARVLRRASAPGDASAVVPAARAFAGGAG